MKMKSKLTALLIFATLTLNAGSFLFPHTNPAPVTVTLAWSASVDPTVTGYNVYWGTGSRQYTALTNVGPLLSCTVSNLSYGTNYFFAATAYNAGNLESLFSSEVNFTPIQSATNTPPTSPPVMKPIVVLTAQYKNNPLDFQWADLVNLSIDPSLPFQEFRLAINNGSVMPMPTVKRISPPPSPAL